jgi:hypothetical protein
LKCNQEYNEYEKTRVRSAEQIEKQKSLQPVYCNKSREKSIKELGTEEYLRLQAEQHRNYLNNNPDQREKQLKTQKESIKSQITRYKTKCAKKQIKWDITDEIAAKLLKSHCTYCNKSPEPLNGIDRVDVYNGYTVDNSVAACGWCNNIKGCLDPIAFYNHCSAIFNNQYNGIQNPRSISKAKLVTINEIIYSAKERDIECTITDDVLQKIINDPCHICGTIGLLGVDRVDNEFGYVADNIKMCCSICNYMKKDKPFHDFLMQIIRIVTVYCTRYDKYSYTNPKKILINKTEKNIVQDHQHQMDEDEKEQWKLDGKTKRTKKMIDKWGNGKAVEEARTKLIKKE